MAHRAMRFDRKRGKSALTLCALRLALCDKVRLHSERLARLAYEHFTEPSEQIKKHTANSFQSAFIKMSQKQKAAKLIPIAEFVEQLQIKMIVLKTLFSVPK
jgi:hypothetical protein